MLSALDCQAGSRCFIGILSSRPVSGCFMSGSFMLLSIALVPTQPDKGLKIRIPDSKGGRVVGAVGFEPTTVRLKVECSTN